MASKKWRKRIKNFGRNVGKGLRTVAPLAPLILGGPAGIALGGAAALSGSALKGGNRKKKFKALKRAGIQVAGSAAFTGALGLVSGQGIGASALTSVKSLLSPAAAVAKTGNLLDEAKFPNSPPTSVPGSGINSVFSTVGSIVGAISGGVPGAAGVGSGQNEQNADRQGFGPFGPGDAEILNRAGGGGGSPVQYDESGNPIQPKSGLLLVGLAAAAIIGVMLISRG